MLVRSHWWNRRALLAEAWMQGYAPPLRQSAKEGA